jgi:4-amino-4-deoxy-L-arabinose transferase-like glycosyltransferase
MNNPFITGWFHFPSLFFFLPASTIALGGRTIEVVRLPAAIAGACTVVGVFGLSRSLFGRMTGWLSAILLAGISFHIHFSRIGLNNIWDGLFTVCTLLFFWKGWKSGDRRYFLIAGGFLGLSQYFYASSHILPAIILL